MNCVDTAGAQIKRTDCEENVDECMSNPCQNGGHCRDRNNGYTCTCQPGYLGDHCEIDVAVCETGTGARCHNGGECIEGPGLEFSCECAPGWHGRICQDEVNECDSAPCQNGGVCVDKLATYVCACPMGYTGTNCEEEILICADNPCQNNALCLMEEGVPTCYCVPDYHGEKCEFQYDECQLGPRCMNGGVCIDGVDTFSCSCPPLLTGMLCECLMIGEDSLDCNYTAPSTSATPVYSKPKYMPTAPVTVMYSKPKYLPTTPAFPIYTKPKWVTEITTAKTYVTTMFLGEDISSEITKSSEESKSTVGESLEKPIIGQSSEEITPSTKKTYISSPGWGEEISPIVTELPGIYQKGSKDISEVAHSSEASASVEITGSDEFTTIAKFDESSDSGEITTVKPISISGDLDYVSVSKSSDSAGESKEDTGKEGIDIFELPPTKTSYVPSVITTSIDTSYNRGIDYVKPTRPPWVGPPTYYPTLSTSHATSKPESDSHFSTTYFTTLEEHSGIGPTKTIPIIRPGMPTTTTAPFFTDYPEVVITTKYYDFGHKEKDKEIGITPRPHMPTYSVTTIGTVRDYEGPAITTAAPGISITVYSPENRTYPHHYPTPYQPLATTTTSTMKTYYETTTPYYHPSPTLTAGTIKPSYHPEITGTTTSPQHLYTEDLITQRIPVSIPEMSITAKTDFPEIVTEYHHAVVTYGPPPTYKPTIRPTLAPPTKIPTMLPPKPTLLPQPTLPPTAAPTPVTLTPQPLPAQPTLLPLPATLLPPQPTYLPPVYSTHQTVTVKIPTAVGETASEEEESANTVSPLIPGGTGIGSVSHAGGSAVPVDTDSQADCIKMGCYNGGTCVTTSEGSRNVC
uniref:EGF-like domain-containing protein n=1 Tax=Glossina brevipalpis TaxID=37001 RepID=A0A1A9WEY9_9MUSC